MSGQRAQSARREAIVDPLLDPAAALAAGPAIVGGKAHGLARLHAIASASGSVPPWFVVVAEASLTHLGASGALGRAARALAEPAPRSAAEREAAAATSAAIVESIEQTPLDPGLAAAVREALDRHGPGPWAVRSSMVGEDEASRSYAGQLSTALFRDSADEVLAAIVQCWASAYSPHALAYRRGTGQAGTLAQVAVVVQQMVSGQVSGVLFTAHPTTGRRDHCLVTATWGLGEGVVSGRCNTDEYVCAHDGEEIETRCASKDTMTAPAAERPSGTAEVATEPSQRDGRCLTRDQVARLAKAGAELADSFGIPLDLEWTLADGQPFWLQARPITALPAEPNDDGPLVVFDNSNIQESYCGVTTPLTFSFAEGAYASVYAQTMRAVGLPEAVIESHREMLSNMLGLVRGRVYYNINNWYRGLLLLPSFGRNKADMEAMMGLEEPVEFVADQVFTLGDKLRKLPRMLLTLARFLRRFRRLDRDVPRFLADFERAYEQFDRASFEDASFSTLIDTVGRLKSEIMDHWATPIINDFYVMMATGKLRRLIEQAGVDNPTELLNDLLAGEPGIESLEPTRKLMRLARQIGEREALAAAIRNEEPAAALKAVRQSAPEIAALIDAYLERYGDRVIGELKLETVTAREDPSFVVQVLKNYLGRPELDADRIEEDERQRRQQAEATLGAGLGPLGRWRCRAAVRRARRAIKHRENMRLARTRLFGLVRDTYRGIGKRLHEAGKLEAPRDVFYLTTGEVLAYHQGRSVTADLSSLVAVRKAEFATYAAQSVPHHFQTLGPVYHGNDFSHGEPRQGEPLDRAATVLQGIGCYPGRVEGRLRIVMGPEDDLSLEGRILTTLRTDPGWTPLFPAAAGILVERGSSLSHSAIVARELGIPAVVGVPGLLQIVTDGERVKLDGGAGTVERLDHRATGGSS
ncbi:MAG: phosphoenolpyruvate synthase [Deltaproteobacteria bacterium]|jgi:pyruvate,water dikinase|nr:phosphoenolpyruvate synthase [Deltaproteobacteria bacterium]MBW2536748.1 phosphoenolpyruvate synthase [Deltaproteobacteria bacterium]